MSNDDALAEWARTIRFLAANWSRIARLAVLATLMTILMIVLAVTWYVLFKK